jgi:hypothetical protein
MFDYAIITVAKTLDHSFDETKQNVYTNISANGQWVVIHADCSVRNTTFDPNGQFQFEFLEPSGIFPAMNEAIQLTNAKSVFFLNAGDIIFDWNTFSAYVKKSIKLNALIACGHYVNDTYFKPKTLNYLHVGMPFSHQAMIYPRDLLQRKFMTEYSLSADYEHLRWIDATSQNYSIERDGVFSRIAPFQASANYCKIESEYLQIKKAYGDRFNFLTKLKFAKLKLVS